jgi:hypothetical protein
MLAQFRKAFPATVSVHLVGDGLLQRVQVVNKLGIVVFWRILRMFCSEAIEERQSECLLTCYPILWLLGIEIESTIFKQLSMSWMSLRPIFEE